jgi:diadenosine tetraphosphate (Ap4A) HIT family hydrolase
MTNEAMTQTPPDDACFSCAEEARLAELPPRQSVAHDEHWRVVHAFDTSLPGWLILLPRRHVTAIGELTDAEAVALGSWQVRLSRALHEVTGCPKTYIVQFAEAQGYAHVHFHVTPRPDDAHAEYRGPRIFGMLGGTPPADRLSDDRCDALALAVTAALR